MFVPINTQRGENRRAKQTNTNRMSTAELDTAEEKAFIAKREAWAAVIFASTAEEIDRASGAYQRAVAAYSEASRARYNSQPSQPGRQIF